MKFHIRQAFATVVVMGVSTMLTCTPASATAELATTTKMTQPDAVADLVGVRDALPSKPANQALELTGLVRIREGCSGTIFRRWFDSLNMPALMLTNGHCMSPRPRPGEVLYNHAYRGGLTLVDMNGTEIGPLTATQVSYATMSTTDVNVVQLSESYQQLMDRLGPQSHPLILSKNLPKAGQEVQLTSGYWGESQRCSIETVVPRVTYRKYEWKNSVRYSKCVTRGGWSGTPIVNVSTGRIVAIHNSSSGNVSDTCMARLPCEQWPGRPNVFSKGSRYGQQVNHLHSLVLRNSGTPPEGRRQHSDDEAGNRSWSLEPFDR